MSDQIQISVTQVSDSASEASIRTHHLIFDRPIAKGGTDTGPMGGETFLASIAGCFMSNLLAAMRAREIKGVNVQTAVTGTLDGNPPRFTAIALQVTASEIDQRTMEKLTDIAGRGCIMVNTLRDKMDFSIQVTCPKPVT